MFGRLDTHDLPPVWDYSQAVEAWNKGHPTRDFPERRWLKHGHRNKWVTRHGDGSIGFVLGGTELVRWHGDNSVVIRPYNSTKAFTEFANVFLPSDLTVNFEGQANACVRRGGHLRYHPIREATRFVRTEQGWTKAEGAPKAAWEVPYVDRAVADAHLDALDYRGFVAWARGVVALDGWVRVRAFTEEMTVSMGSMNVSTASGRKHVLACLAEPRRWHELLSSPPLTSHTADPKTALRHVIERTRQAVVIEKRCVRTLAVPYIDGSSEFNTFLRNRGKYRAALMG